ncbi:hypothetical protein [Niameybacter massiliensis]|uniref:hypothetical protein n=1 Tax=Niameybacter massiliensis TaxID=1658108 RepID=UPI0006B4339C|nr:hypothetical protein [Niameybacter massiliensis]
MNNDYYSITDNVLDKLMFKKKKKINIRVEKPKLNDDTIQHVKELISNERDEWREKDLEKINSIVTYKIDSCKSNDLTSLVIGAFSILVAVLGIVMAQVYQDYNEFNAKLSESKTFEQRLDKINEEYESSKKVINDIKYVTEKDTNTYIQNRDKIYREKDEIQNKLTAELESISNSQWMYRVFIIIVSLITIVYIYHDFYFDKRRIKHLMSIEFAVDELIKEKQ